MPTGPRVIMGCIEEKVPQAINMDESASPWWGWQLGIGDRGMGGGGWEVGEGLPSGSNVSANHGLN
jgi:hypothetical protein